MSDRRRCAGAPLLLGIVAALVLLAGLPSAAFGASGAQRPAEHVTIADVPGTQGEDCVDDPNAQPGVGLKKCETPFSLATLIPFVAGGIVIVLLILVGWYLVMRRRTSRPFLSDEAFAAATGGGSTAAGSAAATASSEWWTCRSCGSTNMVGVARCYKCGAWPR